MGEWGNGFMLHYFHPHLECDPGSRKLEEHENLTSHDFIERQDCSLVINIPIFFSITTLQTHLHSDIHAIDCHKKESWGLLSPKCFTHLSARKLKDPS